MSKRRFRGIVAVTVLTVVAGGIAVRAVDGNESCAEPTTSALDQTVSGGVEWLDRALLPDGSFWYEYDRATDEFSDDYHYVRHVGALLALYQVAADGHSAGDDALRTGDGGLVFVTDQLTRAGDRVAFRQHGRPAILGSSALAVAALVHRRQATGDDGYDELMRGFGRFMLSLERGDGGMWARATGAQLEPVAGVTSTFYTGEAFWAFALLAETFPGEGWDDAARAVGRYIATERDAEEEIENPPLADQWAAYGFSEMRTWMALRGDELAYVRSLIDRYHSRLRTEIDREAAQIGDGSEPPDETVVQARGAGFGTTVEALGSLWRLSRADPGLEDLEGQLRSDLQCGAAILAARQNDADRAAAWPRPEVVQGAWFDEDVTRVDDQQHAISGVLRAIPAVRE